ncbi:hypothetical protein GS440_24660 [Rhodococcus hoagii]|nr:hypothetical protein [Prescottella equi]
MTDEDRRSGAELRARRELLGLSSQETAELLSIAERAAVAGRPAKPSRQASSANSPSSSERRTT